MYSWPGALIWLPHPQGQVEHFHNLFFKDIYLVFGGIRVWHSRHYGMSVFVTHASAVEPGAGVLHLIDTRTNCVSDGDDDSNVGQVELEVFNVEKCLVHFDSPVHVLVNCHG